MANAPIARSLDSDWLERQLFVRGWELRDLATHARLSRGTASNVRCGKRVGMGTAQKIAAAFRAYPPDPSLAEIAEGVK